MQIQSVTKKMTDPQIQEQNNFEVCFLPETWISNLNLSQSELSINTQFNVNLCNRTSRRGGGVTILIKRNLQTKEILFCNCDVLIMDLFILQHPKYMFIVVFIGIQMSIKSAQINCLKNYKISLYPIICGDFNLKHILWSNLSATHPTDQ